VLTHDLPLPLSTRRRLYLKVGKKVRPPAGTTFTQRVPGGVPVQFVLDGTVRELFWVGAFEVDSLPWFVAYARRSRCVLDVGAAEGLYGLLAGAVAPDGLVLAFEPGSRQVERLQRNLELNRPGAGERVQLVEVALSDHDGEAQFFELPGGTSSLNPEFRAATEPRVVTLARGDDVVRDLVRDRPVDLVKVDTESTEPEVLAGLRQVLAEDRPVVFCEVLRGRTEERLQPLVDELGYRTWWLGPDGPVRRDRIDGVPTFVNWLFLPDDATPLPADPIF
jgi:FkbM family methyltransferase